MRAGRFSAPGNRGVTFGLFSRRFRQDVDTEMTRSITSNFAQYIDASSMMTWGVYSNKNSEDMRVNYLEAVVSH